MQAISPAHFQHWELGERKHFGIPLWYNVSWRGILSRGENEDIPAQAGNHGTVLHRID
jgi:hypothetical protein